MTFPGQCLELQIIEPSDASGETLLRVTNAAEIPLESNWRLYFSLGLTPKETEKRVRQTLIDGRYGFLEPSTNWQSLPAGQHVDIPIENWLFAHMPAQARQGFHFLAWANSPNDGVLSEPQCLDPILVPGDVTPHGWIKDLSPTSDIQTDSPLHRYRNNQRAEGATAQTIIPAVESIQVHGEPIKCEGFTFDNIELDKALDDQRSDSGLFITVTQGDEPDRYEIDIKSAGINIKSGSDRATFYAGHTLRQLLNDGLIQPCRISDRPDFEHRGVFVDIARHFHSHAALKKVIRAMAAYKMNRLQLGISNDEGWRLEIEKLPELTEIGAKRSFHADEHGKAQSLYPAWGDGPEDLHEFITKAEFIELLTFANHHHVEIIVEFNLPAHANALIRAIEATGRYQLVDPDDNSTHRSAQGYTKNVVNVCCPDVYTIAEEILSEISDCYRAAGTEMKHIHLGGDEVPEGAWLGSPICHNSPVWQTDWDMNSEADRNKATTSLQQYYAEKIINIATRVQPDIQIGFWHEMSPALPETDQIYITGWTTEAPAAGIVDGVLERNQKLVIANASFLYLDMPYSLHVDEPGLPWAAYVSTERIFGFKPLDCWQIEAVDQVAGMQAQLWTETVTDSTLLDYYLFPRLLAVADRCWRHHPGHWPDFAASLGARELAYLETLNIDFRLPPPGIKQQGSELRANVSYPGLTIRYNINGEDPSANCPSVDGPIDLQGVTQIRLATFSPSGQRSSRVEIIENLANTGID